MDALKTRTANARGTIHVVVFATLAVGIAAGAWRISSQNDSLLRENLRRQLSDLDELKINELMNWQAERKGDASLATTAAAMMPELEKALEGQPAEQASALSLMADIRRSFGYTSAELLDRQGQIRLTSGASPAGPLFYRSLVDEAAGSAKLLFRYFPKSGDLQKSVFAACVPLRNRNKGEFGSLVLVADPWLSPFPDILRWPSATRTGRLFLVRREGLQVRVMGTQTANTGAGPHELLVGFSQSGSLFAKAFLLQEGTVAGVDEAGRRVTGFVRHLPFDPEDAGKQPRPMLPVMLALMEESEAFAPMRQNELMLALASGMLILLFGTGIGWIWRRQFLQFYREQLRSQQERRALIGHYDFLTRFANDAVFLADSSGTVVQVNERASDFYGYSQEEMIGMKVQEFRAPGTEEDYERARENIEQHGRFVFESTALRKDGSAFPAELSVRVMEVDGAQFRQTIVRDITERRRSQEQIGRLNRLYAVLSRCGQSIVKAQEEAALFREVVHVAVDSGGFSIAAIGTVDGAGRILPAARAGASADYLDAVAQLPDDAIAPGLAGKAVRESGAFVCNDLWQEAGTDLSEGRAAAVEAARRFNVRSLLSLPLWCGARPAGELRFYSSEAEFFNEEETALATEVAENLSFALESLERKRKQQSVEAELRRNRERLEMVLDAAEETYWDWDLESGEILQSPRYDSMLGYGPFEIPRGYQEWMTLLHPEDVPRISREFSAFASSGIDLYSNEFRMRSKSGEYIWVSCRGKVVRRNSSGSPARIVGTMTDVTDRKKLEEQFRQSQKLESVGRLAGGVAHDFNNLLTVINGYSRLLIRSTPPSDPRLKQLEEIRKAGERAAELTRQLLTFSRKHISEPRLLSLNSVAADSETMLRRLTPGNIEFSTSLTAGQDEVLVDPSHVQQILMNLVVNACDAMPSGGKLGLRTFNADAAQPKPEEGVSEGGGTWLVLEVTDTGVGMDEETLRHIFEPFFTTKDVGKGTGLGLSTVYGIVQQCGGTVRVESVPGAGTTFRIYLPVTSHGVPAPGSDKPAAAPDLKGTETVLLVEDQDVVREFTENALRSCGYFVISAAGGSEALELAKRHAGPIHLLISDVVMPTTNGWAVAKELRKTRPETKVIFMSGLVDDVSGRTADAEPDAEYLQKPFSPEALADKVRRTLNKTSVSRTVLVVEDEAAVRGLFTEYLGRKHRLLMASDGKEALGILESGPQPDLVITDLVMPNQQGMDLIREIRKSRPAIRIIAMSGAFSGRFLKTAELLGADATLVKPIRPEVLDQVIDDVMKQPQAAPAG